MVARFNMFLIAGLISLTLLPAGCSRKQGATTQPCNVLLVVIDTLRVDKLGCYGSDLGLTPRIDRLADEGTRFERAYSHAPWTLPAFASMLTSLYPPQHNAGGSLPEFHKLPESVRTVAECFRDRGFATAEVVNVLFLNKALGTTQGFDHVDLRSYRTNTEVRSATETTDAALAWLKLPRDKLFFLMVHYFDPHLVYAPPPPYRQRFALAEDQRDAGRVFGTRRQIVRYRRGLVHFDDATIRRAEHLYNGEVAYTDHEVGRLLDGLRKLGLADSTVVALTADHGEEFLDHGGFEHGHTLYNELVHVPLIIRDLNGLRGREVPSVVAHVDLAPTLCDLAGIEPDPAFAGRSLVGLMKGLSESDHPIMFKGNFWGPPLRGWLQGGHKLILADAKPIALFNLAADYKEKNNLLDTHPEQAKRMVEDLELAVKKMLLHARAAESPVQLSEDELDRLRSLGYVGD